MRGTDNLDPGLFERVISLARFAGGRRAGDMQSIVVMTQPQRDRIRHAAQLRHLRRAQSAGGGGQPGTLARKPGGSRLIGHFHIRGLRDCPERARGCPLEILCLALVVAGAHRRYACLRKPVAISSLKQR